MTSKPIVSWCYVAVGLSIITGCGRSMEYTQAVVDVTLSPKGTLVNVQKTITDPQEIRELLNFFPHPGEGRESSRTGTWASCASVRFTSCDGKVVTAQTNYNWWTEGKGDWEMDKRFSQYITLLLERSGSPTTTDSHK